MQIIFDEVDHSYTSEYGQVFVSVTRICKKTPRAVDFSSLPNKEAVERARERGKMIHSEVEDFVKKGIVGITKVVAWFQRVLYPMFTDWESEVIVYSEEETLPYAGTIDLICRNRDRWLLIDLKNGGHETVDYQLTLYKRAFCRNRNIDPDLVDLACIDARDEEAISFFRVRTIVESWILDLLTCYANDLPYVEPLPTLKGFDSVQVAKLMQLESYITSVEAFIKQAQNERDSYREKLFQAMDEAMVDTFEIGSLKVTRVKPTTQASFDSAKFKTEHKDLYEQYQTTIRKKGYLKVTVRDITAKGDKK